jgi:hypothetical protein
MTRRARRGGAADRGQPFKSGGTGREALADTAWWKRIREMKQIRDQMREAQEAADRASTWQQESATARWHRLHDRLRAAQGRAPIDRGYAHLTEGPEGWTVVANPAFTPLLADIEYDGDGYATTDEGRAWKQWQSGEPPRHDADAAWFEHFREDIEWMAAAGLEQEAVETGARETAGERVWRERLTDRPGTPAILPRLNEPDGSQGADPSATAEEIAEIREQFNAGEPTPDIYDAEDMAIWRAARVEAWPQEAVRDWQESRGWVPRDVQAAEREAQDRGEREPGSEAQEAASARLEEAVTHADQARTAHATAWAAERAAPDGSIAQADARAARLAAKEAQFYADLEVMDARETFRWLRRAYSAPPTWLAVVSPDRGDVRDALMAAQGKTPAEPETGKRQAWLRYLADEKPANDAEARWFETFREGDRQAQDQNSEERDAWQRFTQGEAPQDDAEAWWFAYWEERHAFQRYAQGEEPRGEPDRQRFARFEQELAAYGEPGREALDPGERPPQREAGHVTSGRLTGALTDAEQVRLVAVNGEPDAQASGRDQQAGEPGTAPPGSAGLTAQHHKRGHQAEDQPTAMLHDGPETAAATGPAGSGADYQPTAADPADPAEPEQTGPAAAAPQRQAQRFPSHDRAGASIPGQFPAGGWEPTAPSRPWRQSAYAADDIHRQGQANPEADFEAGS